ncbi:hypothetical protein, conserved [Babesia bigemina]|uniref:Uncharacterized protein n=1 Tax=Babesia bigemina TaxID=5866 RepID=A0A061D432_BABBI|nr:hypothetical protein, conserved [Babesia bigemina]CDR95313.1 hypothetical protein, conserved [Babesia bigemina]|eukprot:XP_012767499.1 hypothetical protein, conserved [Babesia bigemina]
MDVEPFERLQNDASCMASLAKGLVAGPMEVMESICKFVINAEKSDELSDEGKIQILKSMKGICRSLSKSIDEKYGLTAAFKSELRGSELEKARMLFYYTVMKAFRNEMEKRRHRNPDSEHDAVRKMKLQLMNLDKEISQLKQQLSLYNRVKKRINQSKLSTQGIDENRTDVEKNLFQRDFRTMMIAIQTMLRQHNIATTRHVKKLETKNDIASKAIFDATENINSQLLHRILEKSNWYKDETISSESATPSEVVDASKICDENVKATETTESLAKDEMVVSDVASAKTIVDTSDKHVDAVCEVTPKDAYDSEVVEQVDDELDATGVDKGVESEAALVAGSEPLSVTAEDLVSELPNPEADAEVILAQEAEQISPISHEAVDAAVEHDEPAAPMGEDVNDKSVTEEVEPSAMLSEEAVEEEKTTAEVEEVATEVKEAAMVSKAVIKRDISISMQSTIDHNADEDIVATNSMESVNQEMAGVSNLAVDSASDDAVEESVDENVDSVENTPVLETPEPLNATLERSDEPTEDVPEVANEISESVVANETSEEIVANETSEEIVANEISEEIVSNEISEEIVANEISEEIVANEISEEIVANEISEETAANEISEETAANEISEEVVANESFDVDTTNVASCPSPDLAEVCDMSSGETCELSAPEENAMPIAEEESVIPLSTRNDTLSEPAEVSMPPHPQASPLPENSSSSVPVGMPMESDVTPVESTSLALDTDLDIITNTDAEEPTQETERTADEETDVNYSMEDDVSERVDNEVSATTITINKNPSLFKIKLEIDTNELWNEIQNLKRDIVDLKDTLVSLKSRVNVPESGDKMVDEIPPLSEAEAVDDNADAAIIDNTVTETSNNENVSFVEREITMVDESPLEEGSHMAVVDDTNVEEPSQTPANVLEGELHEDVETELVTDPNESLENVVDSEVEESKEDLETLKPEDANLVAGDSEGSCNAESTNDKSDSPENDTDIVVSPVEESELELNNLVVELDKSNGDFVGGARDVDTPYHSAFFDVPSTPVESLTPTPYEQPNQTIYFDAETFGSYITAASAEVAENKDSLTTPNIEAALDVTENADGNANELMSNENSLETAITNETTATDANEHGEVEPITEETNISDEPEITNADCDLEAEMLHETEEQAEITVESEEIDETVNAEVDTISAVEKEANAHEMHHDSLSDVPSTHGDANEGLASVESTDNLLTKEEDIIAPGADETERGDITRPTSSDNCPKPTERTEEAASTSVMGVENTARSDILDDDEFVKEIIDELGSLDKADDEALLRELEELYTIMTQQLVYGTTTGSLDDEASSCMSLEASDNEEEFDNGRFKQRKAGRISDPSNVAEYASEDLKNTRALNQYNDEESTSFFNGLGATAAVQEENTVTTKGLPFFVGIFSQIPQLSQPISTETIEKQYEEFKQFQAFISLSSRKNQNEV